MYRELAGIQIEEAGYHKARIAPSYDCGLEYVKGSLRTPYGTLQSVWEKKGKSVYLEVMIPVNTSAAVILPDGREVQVGSGTWRWNG